MRISDWSSDVCSSDLRTGVTGQPDLLREAADAAVRSIGQQFVRRTVKIVEVSPLHMVIRGQRGEGDTSKDIIVDPPGQRVEIGIGLERRLSVFWRIPVGGVVRPVGKIGRASVR